MSFRSLPALSRRRVASVGLAVLVSAATCASAFGQTPPAQTPPPQTPPAAAAAPAQPAAPQLPFSSDAGLILFTVKADGAADFEAAMAKFKEGLAKSTKPAYQQMGAGWKLFKGMEGAEPGQLLYVGVIDPAVKGVDYDPRGIIKETFPAEATVINQKLLAALVGVNKLNLVKTGG